jgi:CDP-diacylglycerol--serine O-phosphatidyltransferase
VPGFVMYKLIQLSTANYDENQHADELPFLLPYLKYIAFTIPVFSAIRLAIFNNDTRQTSSFIGLPTPANAIFICSIPLISEFNHISLILNPYLLIGISVVFSLLLVAELPLFALKFRNFSWVGNRIRFVFLGLSLIILITLQFIGIPLIIIMYVLLSVDVCAHAMQSYVYVYYGRESSD